MMLAGHYPHTARHLSRVCLTVCCAGFIAALCFSSVADANAQALDWGEEYAQRIKAAQTAAPLTDELFGDSVNLFNGTVTFRITDISLPGNTSLPVALTRVFSTQDVSSARPAGEWELDVPHLVAVHPDNPASGHWAPLARCSTVSAPPTFNGFSAQMYWSGTRLDGVGGAADLLTITTDPRLIRPAGVDVKWTTKSRWFFSCLSQLPNGQPGEGFIGLAPDGTRYTFDLLIARPYSGISKKNPSSLTTAYINRKSVRLYATKVEDRFGNSVTYSWENGQLKRISSSDGRAIDLIYNDGRLASATAAGRSWTYAYSSVGSLEIVQLPDGSSWRYTHTGPGSISRVKYHAGIKEWPLECSPMTAINSTTGGYSIHAPSGALAQYVFSPLRHGRTRVPEQCISGSDDDYQNDYNAYAVFHDVMSLQSKTVSGPGISSGTYTYRYDNLEGAYEPPTGSTASDLVHKRVTVVAPDGVEHISVFGKAYGVNEGQLLESIVREAGVDRQRAVMTYLQPAELAVVPFAPFIGSNLVMWGDSFNAGEIRPETSARLTRDGSVFQRKVLSFDKAARAMQVERSSQPAP